jgi:xanthine dehydrogenase/oxidase
LTLDRDQDMMNTGHRHPFMGRYKVGFNRDGKLVALQARIWSNGTSFLPLVVFVLMETVY